MLNLTSVMVGTQRLEALAAFYEQVIGKPADMVDQEQGFMGWQVGSAYFSVLTHSAMQGAAKDPGHDPARHPGGPASLAVAGPAAFLE